MAGKPFLQLTTPSSEYAQHVTQLRIITTDGAFQTKPEHPTDCSPNPSHPSFLDCDSQELQP